MDGDGLIEQLGYREAAGFLDESRWDDAIEHAHVFRHTAEACRVPKVNGRFRGIYMLGLSRGEGRGATTPLVYVAEAPDTHAADTIHHIVWNQAVVPFLLVHTPAGVRLYTGFDYKAASSVDSKVPASQRGILDAAIAFEQVATKLDAFRAEHIDDGGLWAAWGDRIDPSKRVDVRLLRNLEALGKWLREEGGLRPSVAHALIGRFVYLRYLRERGILSDTLLRSWNLDPGRDLGRSLRLSSFRDLLSRVDERLNGCIFPLALTGPGAPSVDHVRMVAGAMLGDDPETGQVHLDFGAYDFSHIPIATLSAVYEQFMAAEGRDRDAGAFYTPIPLVSFILGELDDARPLKSGMRVFDPACGSGAFLVQCYQRLVETRRREGGSSPSATELREILTAHIFGMDRDEDACRVTELSLALALLDQIPSETLTRLHNFKLPDLHGKNIVHGDFFEAPPPAEGFDWIVGNPPWVQATPGKAAHGPTLGWIKAHAKTHPVSGHQMAEAFAWRAPDFLRPGGVVALVLPATTFFKEQRSFREAFLPRFDVQEVVNLTNLRRVLFEGRAETPAFVMMYSPRGAAPSSEEDIAVYSPLVANQEVIRPAREGERRAAWAITIDHAEVRLVPRAEVGNGDPLYWKTSMWGGSRDVKLLRALARRFPSLEAAAQGRWRIREGLQLRDVGLERKKPAEKREELVPIPEVRGKPELLVGPLKNTHHVHSFPEWSLQSVPETRAHGRKGRVEVPLSVCSPPHIIIHAGRSFAVFSDQLIVVPPRQIGIAGGLGDEDTLRALTLYLSSDFVWYHQFLTSPEMEYRGRSTIDALKRLPMPLGSLRPDRLRAWIELHRHLVSLSDRRWSLLASSGSPAPDGAVSDLDAQMTALEAEVNHLTARTLGLTRTEEWLVEDLVGVRRHLADGKVGEIAVGPPTSQQLMEYAATLRDGLDAYLDRGRQFQHALTVVHEQRAGMIQIAFEPSRAPHVPLVEAAGSVVGRKLRTTRDRIDREHGQWLYFDRNLAICLDGKVFLCKPMQRVWWTRSQALADADRIIADLVTAGAQA